MSYAVVAVVLLLVLVTMVARRVAATEASHGKPTWGTFSAYSIPSNHRCLPKREPDRPAKNTSDRAPSVPIMSHYPYFTTNLFQKQEFLACY